MSMEYDELEENEPDLNRWFKLTLTKKEILYISDHVTRMMPAQPMHHNHVSLRSAAPLAMVHVDSDFIEKIGRGVAFFTLTKIVTKNGKRVRREVNSRKGYTLSMNELDMWFLWEIAVTYRKMGKDFVGYRLKAKLAQALYGQDQTADRLIEEAIGEID